MEQTLGYIDFDPESGRLRLDPHDDRFVQNPYAAYAFLHGRARAFYWEEYGFWCVPGYEDVNRLFRDRRLGRERLPENSDQTESRDHLADFDRIAAHSMLELEPPVHTRLRGLVNRAFVSRQIERLRPRLQVLANELVDRFEAAGSTDLLPNFATPVPLTIICEMLGVPTDDGEQLLDWSHRMVAMYMHGRTRETELSANEAAAEFTAYLRSHIHVRQRSPGDDLISLLISARDEGQKLSEDELISSIMLLLKAGHEATVHQTGNAVHTILKSGVAPSALFADDDIAARAVEECLRIDPPLHMFTRIAYEELEPVPGLTLRRGDEVGLLLGAANHDPTAFEQPGAFNPARTDQKNVSFGAGIHFCIGAPLARLEMQASLKILFDRLPKLRLADNPKYRDTFHFHGLERLDIRW